MKRSRSIDDIKVASPCPASWAEMIGDDKVRFCTTCSLNVYNLTAMTRAEAQAVLDNAKGRLCVRFYRRQDGRVLTQDCPIGKKDRQGRVTGNLVAASAAALTLAAVSPGPQASNWGADQGEASAPSGEWIGGTPALPDADWRIGKVRIDQQEYRMGRLAPNPTDN